MDTFMVSVAWNGYLNIGHMRTFPNEERCWRYVEENKDNLVGVIKVYQLYSDREPRLCKKK